MRTHTQNHGPISVRRFLNVSLDELFRQNGQSCLPKAPVVIRRQFGLYNFKGKDRLF